MADYLEVGGAVALTAAAGAAAAYYLLSEPAPVQPPVPLDDQSAAASSGSEQARTSRQPLDKYRDGGEFVRFLDPACRTLHEVPRRGLKLSGDGNCLGWRADAAAPYQWLSYGDFVRRARDFGSGLVGGGLSPGQSTLVGIYAQNRPEWVIAEYGCYAYSIITVALYDTLGPEACSYIVAHGNISTVVVDSDARALSLLEQRPEALQHIIHMGELSPETARRVREAGLRVSSFAEVESRGALMAVKEIPPRPQDVATISYTSGTTGDPKGVMLTHENVVANVSAVLLHLDTQTLRSDDVMLSFLPLSHTFERVCQVGMYMVGGAIGFYRGDIRGLMDDLKALRPTCIPAVPRIFNRIHDKTLATAGQSRVKSALLRCALAAKERQLARGVVSSDTVWDKYILAPVRAGFGGRLRVVVVGSAPMAPAVLTFMRAALGCLIVEGYGQTECVCPCTLTMPGDHTVGHVGPPLSSCAIKLADVPDMGYSAADGRGEVCVRGAQVFKGYYRAPELTDEALDEDGWLHTGDIGQWLPNGTLRIIDRKKNIFKLSQGEYVAPERLENIFMRSPLVGQIFVDGDSLKSCLVAVVVPDSDSVKAWRRREGVPDVPLAQLCAEPPLKAAVMAELGRLAAQTGLKGFEKIKDVYLSPEPLSTENGLLTPTLKAKRPQIRRHFQAQIADMYSRLE
ncbi:long-chain-fatty-acid--CoA ligase 5-like [Amphibalanus amphitrite]|uniref:long-chain-fatty-acid--CoA ligase 5-like n=1 Tax=Amphibalanus amphitrite TaxID=1232801 RepID=UPI001C90F4CD|nr:long-chain-fatty-acid--CoA ligase 5-like [Amphibalanus amphitrite]XP_043230942.1 long-chain-fatty-acid--CoA ligase 5-like [Amphibalanus amphitrite]XP_043230943.1 long-chain-fatty-acid--CoA ligase 5-like [Amphibalanus amphitrite]